MLEGMSTGDQAPFPAAPGIEINPLAFESFKRARDAWATAEILEGRANRAKRQLQVLTFVGLAVPLLIGLLTIAYHLSAGVQDAEIWVGSGLLVVQAMVALWSLTAKWDDRYSESMRSSVANRRLFQSFDRLLRDRPAAEAEFRRQLEILIAQDDTLRDADHNRGGMSEAERRFGLRTALFRLQAPCAGCATVPPSIVPSNSCGVCGGFTTSRYRSPRLRPTHRSGAE